MLNNNGSCLRTRSCAVHVTIFSYSSIIPPGFKFTKLHALTLAAHSYALLPHVSVLVPMQRGTLTMRCCGCGPTPPLTESCGRCWCGSVPSTRRRKVSWSHRLDTSHKHGTISATFRQLRVTHSQRSGENSKLRDECTWRLVPGREVTVSSPNRISTWNILVYLQLLYCSQTFC